MTNRSGRPSVDLKNPEIPVPISHKRFLTAPVDPTLGRPLVDLENFQIPVPIVIKKTNLIKNSLYHWLFAKRNPCISLFCKTKSLCFIAIHSNRVDPCSTTFVFGSHGENEHEVFFQLKTSKTYFLRQRLKWKNS